MMPMTNSGSEAKASMTFDATLSNVVSRLRAPYTPIHNDSGIEITEANTSRNRELTTRSLM